MTTLLEQREIEAKVLVPFLEAAAARFGREPVEEVLLEVVRSLAQETGRTLATESSGEEAVDRSLPRFSEKIAVWNEGGALESETLESTEDRLSFDVTRCRYAEMYQRLGWSDWGQVLSCARDFSLIEGFNKDVELNRSQTILGGSRCCDFRFRRREES